MLATLITTAGNKDEELESPSNSMTSSPASLALQMPLSNADIDGPDSASVVVLGATHGGIIAAASVSAMPKFMSTGSVNAIDVAKIKASLSRHTGCASAAQW